MSRPIDPQPTDSNDAYEIVELSDALTVQSRGLGRDHEVDDDLLDLGDVTIERVHDPLFQAFVATGFSRPR